MSLLIAYSFQAQTQEGFAHNGAGNRFYPQDVLPTQADLEVFESQIQADLITQYNFSTCEVTVVNCQVLPS